MSVICRVCESGSVESVINLENQPLSTDFHTLGDPASSYPIELDVCTVCFHLQIRTITTRSLLYTTYLNKRGDTTTSTSYLTRLANYVNSTVVNDVTINPPYSVLDIGCNDGTLLDYFKALTTWSTYGVDPATNLYTISNAKGHTNISMTYWGSATAAALNTLRSNVPFTAITAIDVITCVEDLDAFLTACKLVMNNKTRLYIQVGQTNMILNAQLEAVNHEHVSNPSVRAFNMWVTDNGLKITDLIPQAIYGGSILYELVLSDSTIPVKVDLNIHYDTEVEKYSMSTYGNFNADVTQKINRIKSTINNYLGFVVVGYGASSGGNMILNYGDINLEYIVDDNADKVGLYTPGKNIEIFAPSKLAAETATKIIVLILAPSSAYEIQEKIKAMNKTGKVYTLQYYPDVQLTKLVQN